MQRAHSVGLVWSGWRVLDQLEPFWWLYFSQNLFLGIAVNNVCTPQGLNDVVLLKCEGLQYVFATRGPSHSYREQ